MVLHLAAKKVGRKAVRMVVKKEMMVNWTVELSVISWALEMAVPRVASSDEKSAVKLVEHSDAKKVYLTAYIAVGTMAIEMDGRMVSKMVLLKVC